MITIPNNSPMTSTPGKHLKCRQLLAPALSRPVLSPARACVSHMGSRHWSCCPLKQQQHWFMLVRCFGDVSGDYMLLCSDEFPRLLDTQSQFCHVLNPPNNKPAGSQHSCPTTPLISTEVYVRHDSTVIRHGLHTLHEVDDNIIHHVSLQIQSDTAKPRKTTEKDEGEKVC